MFTNPHFCSMQNLPSTLATLRSSADVCLRLRINVVALLQLSQTCFEQLFPSSKLNSVRFLCMGQSAFREDHLGSACTYQVLHVSQMRQTQTRMRDEVLASNILHGAVGSMEKSGVVVAAGVLHGAGREGAWSCKGVCLFVALMSSARRDQDAQVWWVARCIESDGMQDSSPYVWRTCRGSGRARTCCMVWTFGQVWIVF